MPPYTNRIVEELRRAVDLDVDVADRESITVWLMRMAGGYRLELFHPRTGKIVYEGIRFDGSPEIVFDQYVSHVIEDLVEKHVRYVEDHLADVPADRREWAAKQCEAAINGARLRLRNRAADIKGRLLGNGHNPTPTPIRHSFPPIDIAGRVRGRLAELQTAERTSKPLLGWLERFAKANPALSNLISFLAGLGIAVAGMLLG